MRKKKNLRELVIEKKEEMKKFESIKKWMTQVGIKSGSKGTKKVYLTHLKNFCNGIKKNPNQLIKERKENQKSDDEEIKRRDEEQLMSYFESMEGKCSRNHQLTSFFAVKSFYKSHYLDLKLRTPDRWDSESVDKIPTLDELKLMINCSESSLQRAIIIFMSQSGQRAGVISSLRYKMIKEQLEEGESSIVISISGDLRNSDNELVVKRRQKYQFLVGKDSIEALKVYLKVRENEMGKIKDDDFLFMSEKRYKGIFVPLGVNTVNRLVQRSALKSGLVSGKEKRSPIHSHCLRKFYQTNLEASGVPKSWIDYWMGHRRDPLDRAYSHPTIEQQKESYNKGEKYLSTNKEEIKVDIENMREQIKRDVLWEIVCEDAKKMGYDPNEVLELKKPVNGELTIEEKTKIIRDEMGLWITSREGHSEHRIVNEDELTKYLDEGWEVERELNSGGKFLVRIGIKKPNNL